MIRPALFRAIAPTASHANLAVAKLPYLQATPYSVDSAMIGRSGWTQVASGQYTHTDGSWIACVNGRVERGVGSNRFTQIPSAAQTQTQPQTAASSFVPGYLSHPQFIGHGDLSRALREYPVADVRQFVRLSGTHKLTANARVLAAQHGVA